MTELSVVLITRNQAWNIAKLIESVLKGTLCAPSVEIVLVDSASTDQTVELAKCYPVRILRLKSGQRLSPAIGRYVGYKQSQGEFVLFLDGDTQLLAGWLPEALLLMREVPDVGAVTGNVFNLPTSAAALAPATPIQQTVAEPPREVLWCNYGGGGAALYRRSVFEQVGTFNPYLSSEEEPELGLRIRHAGLRILELKNPMAYHFNDAPVAWSTVLSRRRRRFHLGMGQAARYHLGTKLFWHWLKERWWEPAAVLLVAAGLGTAFVSLLTRDFMWFGLWILALCFLTALLAVRKHSLRAALVAAFNWFVMTEGFLRGFMTKPLPADNFHPDFEVIGDVNGGETVSALPIGKRPGPTLHFCLNK